MYNKSLRFHLIGIGGIGMSGIAEVLMTNGFAVSGSDVQDSAVIARLRDIGATVTIGHHGENVEASVSLVVVSSAIGDTNVEVKKAKLMGIPVIPRAEVLGELMRLKFGIAIGGAHGKTSTTTMVAKILEWGALDPTSIIGGKVLGQGSGVKVGRGKFLVAEADESDKSFLLLHPAIVAVTNIDEEHLEAYEGSFESLKEAFLTFINSVPFYGLAIVCGDDLHVRSLLPRIHRRYLTYGLESHNDVTANDIVVEGFSTSFTVVFQGTPQVKVKIPVPGIHFCLNALAAYSVGIELGIAPETVAEGLNNFGGVSRRTEVLLNDDGIIIINDYGHHPVEIKATLLSLRQGGVIPENGRLMAVFQPHRYSRVELCYQGFCTAFDVADKVFITDIYSAGEDPRSAITGKQLTEDIALPSSKKTYADTCELAEDAVAGELREGDVVIFFGAGSIGKSAERFAHQIRKRQADLLCANQ